MAPKMAHEPLILVRHSKYTIPPKQVYNQVLEIKLIKTTIQHGELLQSTDTPDLPGSEQPY